MYSSQEDCIDGLVCGESVMTNCDKSLAMNALVFYMNINCSFRHNIGIVIHEFPSHFLRFSALL